MKTKDKKIKVIVLLIVMVLLCITIGFYNLLNPFIVKKLRDDFSLVSSKNNLMVHFISVGQGDAIAITFPDETTMLIDCGPVTSATSYTEYIKTKVLGNKNNKEIDYLLLTHADMDHCGGANKLIEDFNVKEVILPKIDSETDSYKNTLQKVENNVKYSRIDSDFSLDKNGCKLTCFGPLNYSSTNATCPLIRIEYQNKSFLFTGDLSANEEKDFIFIYGDKLDSDVLKVGHHGSKTSTCNDFLDVVTPDYSVISTDGKSYEHPSKETISRLNNANSKILTTYEKGSVLFVVGENYDMSVLTGKYVITNFSLNYVYLVIIIEFALAGSVLIVILSKTKEEKREIKTNKIIKKMNKEK